MLGVLFALGALLSWAFGDFFIQKTAKVVGVWKTLFFITITGFIILFPFVKDEIKTVFSIETNIILLGIAILITLFAALFEFAALKQGKFAIVEPIFGIELPIVIGLGIFFRGEQLTPAQIALALIIFVGITLAVTVHHTHLYYHKRIFEKGFILAGLVAITMGLATFLTGVASQETSPLMSIWVIHGGLAVLSFAYILGEGSAKTIWRDLKKHANVIIPQSILDNIAWICFAFAVTLIPISLATTISESYIALCVLLGLWVNKEKIKAHQKIGIALAVIGVIVLSAITG